MSNNGWLGGGARMLAVVLAAAMTSASWAAAPEVLNQVPADAYAVVAVGKLKSFSDKLANSATSVKIPLPSPDLVGYAMRRIGIADGYDPNGSAALVLLKPPASLEPNRYFDGTPPAVLILPALDPKKMLAKFSPTPPDKNGISQVSEPDTDESGFATVVDNKWVVFATKREDVASYLARKDSFAKTASPDTLKVFDANDMVLWANVEGLGPGADRWLDDEEIDRVGMLDLQHAIVKLDPMFTVLKKHAINVVYGSAKQFFGDARTGMVTLRLTTSGATLGLVADIKPDSPMGKFVASQAGRGPVSLKGLPAGKIIAAGSARCDGQSVSNVVGGQFDSILTDLLLPKDEHLANLRQNLAPNKQMLSLVQGASFVLLEPAADGKEGLLNGAMLIDSNDPRQLFDLALQNAGKMLPLQMLDSVLKSTATATPNALTVKNVSLAKISVTMTTPPEAANPLLTQSDREALELLQQMVCGEKGMTMYLAVVGKKMLVIYGSNMSTLESAVAAAQADSDTLVNAPEITVLKDQLVPNPVTVAYWPVARWVSFIETLVAQSRAEPGKAPPAPPPAPANSAPLVMSANISGKTLTAEIHIPFDAVTSTQDAITRLEKALGEQLMP